MTQVEQLTYQAAFGRYASCDPLLASPRELASLAMEFNLGVDLDWSTDRDDWLNLLFSEVVQPKLGHNSPAIITHYPASQSALARISSEDPRTAERYELFVHGVELANGYHELLDADEQRARFAADLREREALGLPAIPIDEPLLAALASGLPDCSGVALGLDRLIMLAVGSDSLREVIAFSPASPVRSTRTQPERTRTENQG